MKVCIVYYSASGAHQWSDPLVRIEGVFKSEEQARRFLEDKTIDHRSAGTKIQQRRIELGIPLPKKLGYHLAYSELTD